MNGPAIEIRVTCIAHPHGGIAKLIVGDQLLFDGDGAQVMQAEVRIAVPFHVHFEEARLACIWKDET